MNAPAAFAWPGALPGPSIAVQPWPLPGQGRDARSASPREAGIGAGSGKPFVISVAHPAGMGRALARERIRLALRQAIAAALGSGVEQVAIASAPGSAPRVLVDGKPLPAGVSLSHADSLSVAAFHARGAVGLDVMQVEEIADWRDVARDYLGPQALALLDNTARAERALAFARAWTAREAHLKCLGLALGEWTALPAGCQRLALRLPPGYAGTLVVGDAHGSRDPCVAGPAAAPPP